MNRIARTKRRTVALLIYWIVSLIAVLFLTLWAARVSQGAISDCIDATCRVTTAKGSTGTGCAFERNQGYLYVLTAAHVVENAQQVRCEFWHAGHQSAPITGKVISKSDRCDGAIIAIPEGSFEGVLPAVIPLAEPKDTVKAKGTITSVGCSQGAWSTSWKGHVLGYTGSDMIFIPPPCNGRSGSAVFDADGKKILGVIRARAADDSYGIATPVGLFYQAFSGKVNALPPISDKGRTPVQCPGGNCPAPQDQYASPPGYLGGLLPSPFRKEQIEHDRQQDRRLGGLERVWPTLPGIQAPEASKPSVDLGPTNEKLDKLATLLSTYIEEQKKAKESTPPAPVVDEAAKKTAEEAKAKAEAAQQEVQKASAAAIAETKAVKEEVAERTSKLAGVLDKILGDQNTLSQRIEDRLAKVKAELGPDASKPEIARAYVKDFLEEKVSDGTLGFTGGKLLGGALGLSAPLAFAVGGGLWLISRRIGTKIQNDEPLLVQKLFDRISDRIEGLKDRLNPNSTVAGVPPATAAAATPQIHVVAVPTPAAAKS
jgi:hypothetical protein